MILPSKRQGYWKQRWSCPVLVKGHPIMKQRILLPVGTEIMCKNYPFINNLTERLLNKRLFHLSILHVKSKQLQQTKNFRMWICAWGSLLSVHWQNSGLELFSWGLWMAEGELSAKTALAAAHQLCTKVKSETLSRYRLQSRKSLVILGTPGLGSSCVNCDHIFWLRHLNSP